MARIGTAPYLDCSSKGDKRFSSFYARIKCHQNQTIEVLYQSFKIFPSGSKNYAVQNRNGVVPVNLVEAMEFYRQLWCIYFNENPQLVRTLLASTGLFDPYGGFQSEVLWSIRTRLLKVDIEQWIARRTK